MDQNGTNILLFEQFLKLASVVDFGFEIETLREFFCKYAPNNRMNISQFTQFFFELKFFNYADGEFVAFEAFCVMIMEMISELQTEYAELIFKILDKQQIRKLNFR